MAKYKGVTIIPGVVFDKKGNQITSLEEALKEDSQCGCGIDCKCGESGSTLTLLDSDGNQVVLTGDDLAALLALLD